MDVDMEKLPGTGIVEAVTGEPPSESDSPSEMIPNVVEDTAGQTAEPIAADAENTAVPAKSGIGVTLRRILSGILCLSGAATYCYLGICGVRYMTNGGFAALAGSRIFGGVVDVVEPIPVPEDVAPEETEPIQNDSANAEYLSIATADIGTADPGAIFNETDYDPDTAAVPAVSVIPEFLPGDTVLLIHTHGTEGYAPDGQVPADEDFRTDDPENSVVAVGSAFAEILRERGIEVIHCKEMFDAESYIDAYDRSAEAVKRYMAEYPEITCVIDIHRDAVIREDGTVVRSDGGSGAQLMIVCGTDEMGADFPDWRENLAFGQAYQRRLSEGASGLVRHMNLRSASFNQQLADRYLLLEVGTCGNTLSEALASAEIAADTFADLILGE